MPTTYADFNRVTIAVCDGGQSKETDKKTTRCSGVLVEPSDFRAVVIMAEDFSKSFLICGHADGSDLAHAHTVTKTRAFKEKCSGCAFWAKRTHLEQSAT